ncbi:MAG TPA: alternative ribosome rescue aminoacyl-tRNA hydrolase ArfB [Cyclobacteriaceae bacterium]|nr:alternative ribosome rescue aminoacyl-tRNA hydrolase ArfB [Cyclobacteriaceae bacterium]
MSFVKRLQHELVFKVSRSGGPGGQNVNKVNSKVTLSFDVTRSIELSAEEKEAILQKLRSKLTTSGVLVLTSQDSRSQLENKQSVMAKLDRLLAKAFERTKPRKATKPSKSSVQKRIKSKKQHSEKKKWRQKL